MLFYFRNISNMQDHIYQKCCQLHYSPLPNFCGSNSDISRGQNPKTNGNYERAIQENSVSVWFTMLIITIFVITPLFPLFSGERFSAVTQSSLRQSITQAPHLYTARVDIPL